MSDLEKALAAERDVALQGLHQMMFHLMVEGPDRVRELPVEVQALLARRWPGAPYSPGVKASPDPLAASKPAPALAPVRRLVLKKPTTNS